MTGDRFSGIAARPFLQEFQHPFGIMFPAPDLDQGSDDGTNHIPKETVGTDTEIPVGLSRRVRRAPHDGQVGRGIGSPESLCHRADRSLVVSSRFFEAGKITRSREECAGLVHGLEVQIGIAAPIREGLYERIFFPVKKISILASLCVETGMKIRRSRKDGMDRYFRGQDGI